MKVNGEEYCDSLSEMRFSPDGGMNYRMIDANLALKPDRVTVVKYNPRIEPGSLEFWGMVLRAGFIHWQYGRVGLPVDYSTFLKRNKMPRCKQLKQPAQNGEVEAL